MQQQLQAQMAAGVPGMFWKYYLLGNHNSTTTEGREKLTTELEIFKLLGILSWMFDNI